MLSEINLRLFKREISQQLEHFPGTSVPRYRAATWVIEPGTHYPWVPMTVVVLKSFATSRPGGGRLHSLSENIVVCKCVE